MWRHQSYVEIVSHFLTLTQFEPCYNLEILDLQIEKLLVNFVSEKEKLKKDIFCNSFCRRKKIFSKHLHYHFLPIRNHIIKILEMSLKPKRVDFTTTWADLKETVKGVITFSNVPRATWNDRFTGIPNQIFNKLVVLSQKLPVLNDINSSLQNNSCTWC